MTTKEKGDKYELWINRIINRIIYDINEEFTFEHNKQLVGYQIDIYGESNNSIIIIDCKVWEKRIQHGTIDQFIARVSRIKTKLSSSKKIFGVFISNSFAEFKFEVQRN